MQVQTVVAVMDVLPGLLLLPAVRVEVHRVGGQGHGQGLGMSTYGSHHQDDGQKHVDPLGP